MLVVGLRVGVGTVNDAVPVIRRRIERIEFQRNIASIDDVVIRPSRDDDCEARPDRPYWLPDASDYAASRYSWCSPPKIGISMIDPRPTARLWSGNPFGTLWAMPWWGRAPLK